ncbi:RNA dependent RNA polymerase, partial [Grapevine leafroll-associated virus 10]|uniref:RNA dependent RNA polymerase n=1 Tax=Grapevine leafroll-associated virus 10 TaxID=367121 RepID=UPI000188483D
SVYVMTGLNEGALGSGRCRPPRSHFEAIQGLLDDVVPGVGSLCFNNCEGDFQTSDFVTNISDFTFSDNDVNVRAPVFYKNIPRVRSHVMTKRQNTLKSNILAYEKRNFCGESKSWHPDVNEEVSFIVDTFFDCYVDKTKAEALFHDRVTVNAKDLGDWYSSRTPLGKGGLDRELVNPDILGQNSNKFKLMVKSDVKFKGDAEALEEFAPGQNIVFHDRLTCAHFSSVFCELVLRLRSVSLPNVILFNGLSFEEFAFSLDSALNGEPLCNFKSDEVDISKYDKSQNTFTKAIELEVYRRLGLDQCILDAWAASEFYGRATTGSRSFSAEVFAQRRTGAANTWIGNTIINMCLLSQSVNPNEFSACCFAGDDSLLIYKNKPNIAFDVYETKFDFDVKFFDCAAMYFCGKFLISDGLKTHVVPDPLKLFVKLGKERPPEDKVLVENWRSFYDVTKAFANNTVLEKLVDQFALKYSRSHNAYAAFCAVNSLRSNPEQFKRLWFSLYDQCSTTGVVKRKR